jgi:rhodanese-related sulfurtransferase
MVRAFQEGVIVALVGAILAFAANAFSPRGLKLSRDYFPKISRPAHTVTTGTGPSSSATNASTVDEQVLSRLKEQGLQAVDTPAAVALFNDPRRLQETIVFIDARDAEHYQKGHIPGAYQLDYYHPEAQLPQVLSACQNAEQIIVYCNGGTCEDSQFTAVMLRDAGIPPSKIHVYLGGITEWVKQGAPGRASR